MLTCDNCGVNLLSCPRYNYIKTESVVVVGGVNSKSVFSCFGIGPIDFDKKIGGIVVVSGKKFGCLQIVEISASFVGAKFFFKDAIRLKSKVS